ncbi:flagellar hook-basal body complex protein FliE [Bacillaceae bacterium Marseille-Q3522]|nr:flagellar hook-basal body complex protein FliE [Bacillaceae bacterium Marseille-Q3522]
MNISSFAPVSQNMNSAVSKEKSVSPAEAQKSFSAFLRDSINQVNDAQITSDQMTEKLVRGENIDLHEVLIASQKASITMQATLEIRNRAVEAYQEMMRMQV